MRAIFKNLFPLSRNISRRTAEVWTYICITKHGEIYTKSDIIINFQRTLLHTMMNLFDTSF